MTESPGATEFHFRTDGNTSRENNPRGSYRTSVRTYTHAAVRAEHDDHTLERAFNTVKSRGVR
ncbi:hypothetical protein [uncultured Microbacterium sp.]|uniref:hypothetical protein n=1 Tax=uncultured Microbacterium sp. TaxID=191216 RepID=UPI0028DCC64E|nr:hypothetical protein [uncultured Microbacterium sp.]